MDFKDLRERILNQHTILSMARLDARGFDSIGCEAVLTTAFVLKTRTILNTEEYIFDLWAAIRTLKRLPCYLSKAVTQGNAE